MTEPVVKPDDGTVTVDLYDANKGKVPRTGGPYQDDLAAQAAEEWRAKVEGREPDLDNPGPYAGTLLVPKSQLVERDTNLSHVSDTVEVENEPVASYEYTPPTSEPDPKQVDWNNDQSIVDAAVASAELEKLSADKPKEVTEPAPAVADLTSPDA